MKNLDLRFQDKNKGSLFYLGAPYEFTVKEVKKDEVEIEITPLDEHSEKVKKFIETKYIENVKNQLLNTFGDYKNFFNMLEEYSTFKGENVKEVKDIKTKMEKIIKKLREV